MILDGKVAKGKKCIVSLPLLNSYVFSTKDLVRNRY